MTEQQRKAPDRPAAECYYAEYVSMADVEGPAEIALQETVNDKAKLETGQRGRGVER